MRLVVLFLTFLSFAAPAFAQCEGRNLIDLLSKPDRDDLLREAHIQPYATGNLWQATRGDQRLILTGTFHLNDPRHDALMARLTPLLTGAKTLLVEAGPAEEEALRQEMTSNPATMMAMQGAGLAEKMPPEEWEKLTAALLQRGIPSSLAEKLRPWFVSMMLAIPPCALQLAALGGGLDKRLIDAAQAQNIQITALESYDTALKLFDGLTSAEQLTMIRNSLQVEDQAADYLQTTSDAFFAEESRLIWEFNRLIANALPDTNKAETDAEFAKMEETLMASRNRNWIEIIEKALEKGPAFAAFGALHLSGHDGVLALLERRGFTIERLSL